LDVFHHLVHKKFLEGNEEDFEQWMISMGEKYLIYNEAMEGKHHPNPLWGLASLLIENLHGERKLDAFLQFQVAAHISSDMGAIRSLMRKYDVR